MDIDDDSGNANDDGIMDVPPQAPPVTQPQEHSQVDASPSSTATADTSMETLFSKFGCLQTLDKKVIILKFRKALSQSEN